MIAKSKKYPSKTFKDNSGKSLGFIRYQERGNSSKPSISATFCHSYWDKNKGPRAKSLWLGKVIDIEENIFYTQKKGIYKFVPPNIIMALAPGEDEYYKVIGAQSQQVAPDVSPAFIVSFGSTYVLTAVLAKAGLVDIFRKPFGSFGDAVFALVLFKLTSTEAHMHIERWWQETYSRYLFPRLRLQSQRISEIMAEIGEEKYWRPFFDSYIEFVKKLSPVVCALIDSTGLPNSIDIDIAKVSSHGGKITRAIRLIVVLDKITGYPVYFKYIPGNIVDKVTVQVVFHEMEAYGIEIKSVIMDAGYCSEDVLLFLYLQNVDFITRFIPNLKVYKNIIENEACDIDSLDYHVQHNKRNMKIKKVPIMLKDMQLYAYVCKDLAESNKQAEYLLNHYDLEDEEERKETAEKLKKCGLFILISTMDVKTNRILALYFERQDIEQLFDYAKNDLDLVPLRKHSEETFRGHIMLCFMATISHIYLTKLLADSKDCKIPLREAISSLNRHGTSVYEHKNFHVPNIPTPFVRKIYKAFKIEIPNKLYIDKCDMSTL
jgi:hypothetical protein